MKHALVLILFAAILASGAQTSGQGPATRPIPFPSAADLQKLHDGGQYRICLQQIARVLALNGDAAKQYDQNSLLLLRGDCLLHLEDPETALVAYTAAAKSPDPAQRAEAKAAILLIHASAGLSFTPKQPVEGGAISIIDHPDRKKAMGLLAGQLLSESKPRIDAALDAANLVPIIDATPVLIDIHSLEIAATGSDAEIRPTLLKIGEHARDLMRKELDYVDGKVSRIESSANQSVEVGGYGGWWGSGRQGLTTKERQALRADAAYAEQITSAASQFQGVSRSLGGTGEKWDSLVESGSSVSRHAQDVLAAE